MKQSVRSILVIVSAGVMAVAMTGCMKNLKIGSDYVTSSAATDSVSVAESESKVSSAAAAAESISSSVSSVESAVSGQESAPANEEYITTETVKFDPTWEYAANSKINSGTATIYHAKPTGARGIVVCINAGHGTKGGGDVKTLCHPDGSPKVTGGTTEEGATEAVAVSSGMTFNDGTPEAEATLKLALIVRDKLLMAGFDVLMIRETDDVQLDNIARTLMANHYADCHIALHYDSTDFDKGVFFMSVPSEDRYRNMEPVASHYQEHDALGRAVVKGIEAVGMKLFEGGEMEMDLTQTSYSTVPSIDLEVGDAASDHSEESQNVIADGIVLGLDGFFQKK